MSCCWCENGECLRCEMAREKAVARQQLQRLREEIDRNQPVFEAMATELSAARPVLAACAALVISTDAIGPRHLDGRPQICSSTQPLAEAEYARRKAELAAKGERMRAAIGTSRSTHEGLGQEPDSTPPADLGGVRLEPALQATEIDKSVNPSNAPGCPECERPLARVQAGARTGWACVSCNAAGDVEGDWLEPVTAPLHQPAGPGNGEVTPEVLPLGGGAGAPFDSGYAPGALLRARFAPPLRGRARRRGGMLRGATERDAVLPAAPWGVDYAGEGGANLVHPGGSDPHGITSPRGDRDVKPLNARNGCDPGCDPSLGGDGLPVPGNSETSTNDASCARGDSNSQARGRRNLKPAQAPPSTQKPDDPGGASVPEATGSRPGSHPGVTTPATPLELLQAARRAYDAARNWAAARALEPLIDAEVTRLAEAARAAPPEPVRLEVVRAKRGEGGSR